MSEIVFRGYLYKSPPESFGSALKPWRQRWCVLADSRLAFPFATPYVRLEYYTNEQYANELDEPKGVIDLQDCNEVVDRRPMRGYDHVFDLCTNKRAYHFAASSIEVKSVWMESLTAVLRNKTESWQVDASVSLRLGVGNNAGDMSMESPVYSSLPRMNDTSSENEEYVSRCVQEDERRKNESAQLPIGNSAFVDSNFQDDYQHLQHKKPGDLDPPPVQSGALSNYSSLSRSFVQDDDVDDYQHLDHKKYNQNGDRAATISTSSSLYHRFNRDDRLNQRPVTMPSVASLYSSLNADMKDDYQCLDSCIIRPSRKDDYQNITHPVDDSDDYSQPRIPAVPARKRAYENATKSLPRTFK